MYVNVFTHCTVSMGQLDYFSILAWVCLSQIVQVIAILADYHVQGKPVFIETAQKK